MIVVIAVTLSEQMELAFTKSRQSANDWIMKIALFVDPQCKREHVRYTGHSIIVEREGEFVYGKEINSKATKV